MSGQFIDFSIRSGALWMSATKTIELKSKRQSPYFFNSGNFSTGKTIQALARAYASALELSGITFDVLFGPAYKGIPLVSVIAAELHALTNKDVGFAFNRKEVKDHGEGGDLIGASLDGKMVVIIDDVITRGVAKREAAEFIRVHGGIPVAIAIAFDRQEQGVDSVLSGAELVERVLGIPTIAATTTMDLIDYLTMCRTYPEELAAIKLYQEKYGAKRRA